MTLRFWLQARVAIPDKKRWARDLDMIPRPFVSLVARAMSAAKDLVVRVDTVTDYTATTMGAERSECVKSTFKAVECVRFTIQRDSKRFCILVTTHLTR